MSHNVKAVSVEYSYTTPSLKSFLNLVWFAFLLQTPGLLFLLAIFRAFMEANRTQNPKEKEVSSRPSLMYIVKCNRLGGPCNSIENSTNSP